MTLEVTSSNFTGITVTNTGDYEINYGVVAATAGGSQSDYCGIQINSGVNGGTIAHHGNANPGPLGGGSVILRVTGGSTIRLVNADSTKSFSLHSDAVGSTGTLSAYLIVKYLGS
jgi:hypothetical protein